MERAGELAGQVALVTGGGRGIGRAIAEALAAAGVAVAVAARSVDQLTATVAAVETGGGRALAVPADVADRASVEAAVAKTERELGAIDLLVNNAGVSGPYGPIWETDPADWLRTLRTNLLGAVTCSHVVLKRMVTRGHGRVVNMSSDAALRAYPFSTAYSTSKAALLRFTDSLAADAAPYGIKVFAISPGIVRTDMTEEGWRHMESGELPSYAGRIPNYPTRSGLTQDDWVSGDLSARLVVQLASGKADALSGRFLHAKDDLDVLIRQVETIVREDLYALRMRRLPAQEVEPADRLRTGRSW